METIPSDISFTGDDMDSLDFPASANLEVDASVSAGSAVLMGGSNLYTSVSHLQPDQIFPSVAMDLQGLTNPFSQIGEIFDTLLSTAITRQDSTLADQQAFGLQPPTLGSPFLVAPTGSILNTNIQQIPPTITQPVTALNFPILQAPGLKQVHLPGLSAPVVVQDIDKLIVDQTQICATAADPTMNLINAALPSQQGNITSIAITSRNQLPTYENTLQEIPQQVDNQQQTDFIDDLDEDGHQDVSPDLQNNQTEMNESHYLKDPIPFGSSTESNTAGLQQLSISLDVKPETACPSSQPSLQLDTMGQPSANTNLDVDDPEDDTVPFLTPAIVDAVNAKLAQIAKQLKRGDFQDNGLQSPSPSPSVQFVINLSNKSKKTPPSAAAAQSQTEFISSEETKHILDETLDVSKFLQNPNPKTTSVSYDENSHLCTTRSEVLNDLTGFKMTAVDINDTKEERSGLSSVIVGANNQNSVILKLTVKTPSGVDPDLAKDTCSQVEENLRDGVSDVKVEATEEIHLADEENVDEDKGTENEDDDQDSIVENTPSDEEDDEMDNDDGDESFEAGGEGSNDKNVEESDTDNPPDKAGINETKDAEGTPVLDLASPTVIREIRELPSGAALSNLTSNKPRAPGRSEVKIKIDDSYCVVENGMKRWKCSICPKSYTTKHNLVTHVLDHSGIKPHCCMICGKFFKQVSHLNTHKLTHGNFKPHTCHVCGKSFTQVSHMKRHLATHMEEKPHICDICSRGFAYPSELKLHKEKHLRNSNCTCEECGKGFPSMKKLIQHQTSSHSERTDLTCEHCGKTFMYPSQLKDHVVKHTGKRPYICGECGMDFMKEHHLRSHQFTHTGLRPFACPICRRAFNQRANMQRHMLIHNPEKLYECEVCQKHFAQPQTLKAHMVTHAEQKPFQCKICGKSFGRLHNLQGHMHMHEENKPYVCFCGSSFTLRGNFNRHKKVKHDMIIKEMDECTDEEAAQILNQMAQKKYNDENDPSEDAEPEVDVSGDQEKLDGADEMNTSSEGAGLLSPQKKKRKSVIPRKALKIDFSEMSVQGMRFTKSREGLGSSECVDMNGAYSMSNDELEDNNKTVSPSESVAVSHLDTFNSHVDNKQENVKKMTVTEAGGKQLLNL